jgi:hypothetical protein
MTVGSRRLVLVLLALAPLLTAAGDAQGDAERCRPSASGVGDPPDLVEATGAIVEQGTSVRWDLRFADPLTVPDTTGHPFRVDILIHDPSVPDVDVAYYHDLNRIVRYDAVAEQGVVILLLPERAQNVFLGGVIEGERLTIQVPGRQVTRDLDLEGVPLEDLRWTVVIRDEHRCDLLRGTRPELELLADESAPPSLGPPATDPVAPTASDGSGMSGGAVAALAVSGAAALALAGYVVARRRRDSSR